MQMVAMESKYNYYNDYVPLIYMMYMSCTLWAMTRGTLLSNFGGRDMRIGRCLSIIYGHVRVNLEASSPPTSPVQTGELTGTLSMYILL